MVSPVVAWSIFERLMDHKLCSYDLINHINLQAEMTNA